MSTHKLFVIAGTAIVAIAAAAPVVAEPPSPRLGTPVTRDMAATWDTTIFPDGRGLPPGRGTVQDGAAIYDDKCSACHGPQGRGETAEELAAKPEPLSEPDAPQTIGSYWPFAPTLFDYIRRAMPMDKPGSLKPDEVYALCAYLLHLNGILAERAEVTDQTLPKVEMPNRAGFDRIDAE